MVQTDLTVVDDLVVSLDYTLRLDDGEIIDSSTEQGPVEFLQGRGQIVPGLEQALYGMAVGEEKGVQVVPDEGYGERNADALQVVPNDVFPSDLDLEPGMALQMRDPSGRVLMAYVTELRPDGVLLDFNHPLAGETLHFQVKVADLRAATAEELAHGHVHDSEHEHES